MLSSVSIRLAVDGHRGEERALELGGAWRMGGAVRLRCVRALGIAGGACDDLMICNRLLLKQIIQYYRTAGAWGITKW